MAFGDADSYARFMGRFSEPLAPRFADLVEVPADGRVLDVGCGPGVLTSVLVDRFGADRVDAIDPTPRFVAAARARVPQVDVREGAAEALPLRRQQLRRVVRPARRALHEGPGPRPDRDGPA